MGWGVPPGDGRNFGRPRILGLFFAVFFFCDTTDKKQRGSTPEAPDIRRQRQKGRRQMGLIHCAGFALLSVFWLPCGESSESKNLTISGNHSHGQREPERGDGGRPESFCLLPTENGNSLIRDNRLQNRWRLRLRRCDGENCSWPYS